MLFFLNTESKTGSLSPVFIFGGESAVLNISKLNLNFTTLVKFVSLCKFVLNCGQKPHMCVCVHKRVCLLCIMFAAVVCLPCSPYVMNSCAHTHTQPAIAGSDRTCLHSAIFQTNPLFS